MDGRKYSQLPNFWFIWGIKNVAGASVIDCQTIPGLNFAGETFLEENALEQILLSDMCCQLCNGHPDIGEEEGGRRKVSLSASLLHSLRVQKLGVEGESSLYLCFSQI